MKRPNFHSFPPLAGILAWLGLAIALTPLSALGEERPPNFIVIFCDNLGYGDIQVTNPGAKQPTPRLLEMAEEGIVFSHAYCAATVCTPSRAALMTGSYPRRVGLDRAWAAGGRGPGHVLGPGSPYGLHPDETTIAEALEPEGYRSICIGKWHLGDQIPFLPTEQGFDEFFGIPYSDDMTENPPLPLMEGKTVIEAPAEADTLVRRGTERAVRFIRENRERPFFLYFPQITPGSTPAPPAHPDFQGKSDNGPWGDSVMELDWSTGRILDTLDELGLSENTLVIWTNDNGAPHEEARGGSSDPLPGEAYNVSEGGMRVPFIARWPGRVPAGRHCDEVISLMDLLPTFTALAGTELPGNRVIDGRDIRPLLSGEPGAASPHQAILYWHVDDLQAVRSGPWKLYLGGERLAGFRTKRKTLEPRLYHLVNDPLEKRNLHETRPGIVSKLERFAREAIEDLGQGVAKGTGNRLVGRVDNPTPRLLPGKSESEPGIHGK